MANQLWKEIKKSIKKTLGQEVKVTLVGNDSKKHPAVFPYIVTKLSPNFYHVIVLPKFMGDKPIPEEPLIKFAQHQYDSNDLDTYLVLGEEDAIFYHKDGLSRMEKIPAGGKICTGLLFTMSGMMSKADFDPTHQTRCEEVTKFTEEQTGNYLLTDFTKGAREATSEEINELSGANPTFKGVPKGLIKCNVCSQFKGDCLDPNENFSNQLVTVHCQCDNKNRCAYCSTLLYDRKLSSNYYNVDENAIYHTTGGCGVPEFSPNAHRCSLEMKK